ncbi:uncharacterized protein [Epargyreus clarus]|uniref:uncharacterized protein n=1 Tax=Epargyreus clarus TaxID=520877 RepID=UPI003C30C463
MALDRQRILGELGSVMKQLQSADCGCLGKLFGNQQATQQAAPCMGSPLPTCGGCRRSCCHGHGCYNNLVSPNQNMYSVPADGTNPSKQPMSGNMFGFGPQIVNMMRGDQARTQSMPMQSQGQSLDPARGLTGPMVIDAPQSPHGKVGLTPFVPPQHGQMNAAYGSYGDTTGQKPNQFTGQVQNQYMAQPTCNTPGNMPSNNMSSWPQQNMANPAAQQMSATHSSPHGQHSQGMAKFNQMFPGLKQGGDLGFDPMAIAIQMNPDNHLQSAMDTMHKIMDKGGNNMVNPMQPGTGGHSNIPQNAQNPNNMMQQNVAPVSQSNVNQIPNQPTPNSPHVTDPNQTPSTTQNTANLYGQPIPQQNQQMYAAAIDPNSGNQQSLQQGDQQISGQQQQYQQQQYQQQQYQQQPQYGQQQRMNLNSGAPNLPVMYEETAGDQSQPPPPQEVAYSNEPPPPQQMIKEPIFPADTSRTMYVPAKHQKYNYGYNTLGQPVEMLPAEMYHPPEPSLPQTLSPQPFPVKSKTNPLKAVNVKATVSKTSLMGKKPVGGTPSRSQLQHIYNQYKGSQSYTQQNVRNPGEGTYSAGKLNVPSANASKAPPVPVERVGGDSVVNNPPSNQVQSNKVEQVMGQIGDVPIPKSGGDSIPVKEAPAPMKKCRNGLQDMVFSSYPTSAAWTFHGHGRDDLIPTHRYQNRRY